MSDSVEKLLRWHTFPPEHKETLAKALRETIDLCNLVVQGAVNPHHAGYTSKEDAVYQLMLKFLREQDRVIQEIDATSEDAWKFD